MQHNGYPRIQEIPDQAAACILFTRFVRREILLEAFFLWIVPLDAVLAITGTAVIRAA